ncbi:MAG TPA: hypothetical protein VFF73_29210, partial [Planctomycetota bacterium]|nr:hypothetical protein [Planctomycetota bacterium]
MRARTAIIGAVATGLLAVTVYAATLFPNDPPVHAFYPPAPAHEWDVSLINGLRFLRPQFPSIRTSADGRIGLMPKAETGFRFNLVIPERIAKPFQESAAGVTILTNATTRNEPVASFEASKLPGAEVSHATILDLGGITPGTLANPYYRSGNDCYDLVVLAFVTGNSGNGPSEIWQTPIHVEVSSPKSAGAAIAVFQTRTPTLGCSFPTVTVFDEPMVTADGRLLVARINESTITWTSSKGQVITGPQQIVYAYNAGTPGNLAAWAQLYPIAHAPFDGRLGAYGFADRQFRDAQNNPIPEETNIPATYPWIDRAGRNLFFTILPSTNYFWDNYLGHMRARYPLEGVLSSWTNPTTASQLGTYDVPDNTRGQCVMGLWTSGKMV